RRLPPDRPGHGLQGRARALRRAGAAPLFRAGRLGGARPQPPHPQPPRHRALAARVARWARLLAAPARSRIRRVRARVGWSVPFGLAFGAALGFLAGLFLAIPAAEFLPGGRTVILGAVGLGALLGSAVAARRSSSGLPRERSGDSGVVEVMSRITFKRPTDKSRPDRESSSPTPVWRPAEPPTPGRTESPAEGKAMQQRDTG